MFHAKKYNTTCCSYSFKFYLCFVFASISVLISKDLVLAEDTPLRWENASQASRLALEEAMVEAQKNSPRIQIAQAKFEEERWKRGEVIGRGFLPKISISGNYFFTRQFQYLNLTLNDNPVSFPSIYPTSQLSLDASLPIFDGLRNVNQLHSANHAFDAAKKNLEFEIFQLDQEVRIKFFQALAADRRAEVAIQNTKTLQDHLAQVTALEQDGAVTKYDVLRVQVQLENAQADEIEAHDREAIAKNELIEILGSSSDNRMLRGELPQPNPHAFKDDAAVFTIQRADLDALLSQSMAAEKKESADAAFLVPKISLGAQYLYYNNTDGLIFGFDSYRSAYNFGVFLSWNLFDGGVSYAGAKRAIYQKLQSEKVLEQARLHSIQELDLWKRKYTYSSFRYKAKSRAIELSQESVRLAREEFKAGSRTSSDVLDAELDLIRSKDGLIDAQLNSVVALLRLELALGRKLKNSVF